MNRIGVVTVTHNSASVLPDFLASVWKQTDCDFLLYAIDSGSTDDTAQMLGDISDPRIQTVIAGRNVGFAAGCNLGIRMALEDGCDSFLLLNNDTVFEPDLFHTLREGLDRHGCDMTTPKMLYYNEPNTIWAAGGHLNPWLGYRNHHDGENQPEHGRFDRPRRVTFTPFCCVLMRSSVIQTIGFLDENYFVYTEDADYCYRALKAGLSIWYLPEAKLRHKVSALTVLLSDFMVYYCTRNRIYFLLKSLPPYISYAWLGNYWMYQWLRRMIGKDTKEVWQRKKQSMRDGKRLYRDRSKGKSKCDLGVEIPIEDRNA